MANDGKQDAMLLDSVGLESQLHTLHAAHKSGAVSYPPDIRDISRLGWHNPLEAVYKPLMAVASEYQTQVTQTSVQWGSETIISIPLYGEFISDVVMAVEINPVSAPNAAFWNDLSGTIAPNGTELIAYVNHPGHQFMSDVLFEVNGNKLDQYSSNVMNFHYKFYVPPNKQYAWNKIVGQENPRDGYAFAAGSIGSSQIMRGSGIRQVMSFVDGYQTPKPAQPKLYMLIPLLFWHCQDMRIAFPSSCIPYGQRNYHITLPQFSNMVTLHHAYDQTLDNSIAYASSPPILKMQAILRNIFVNPTVHDLLVKELGFNLIRTHQLQAQSVTSSAGRELLQNLRWPVETIYCALQPTANLTGPYRGETYNMFGVATPVTVQTPAMKNGYSWGAAALHAPLTAQAYQSAFEAYNRLDLDFATVLGVPDTTILTVNQLNAALTNSYYPPLVGIFANPNVPLPTEIIEATPSPFVESTYLQYTPSVTTISITAQAIQLFQSFPATFYSDYLPLATIVDVMRTTDDPGAYMIPFGLFTGHSQPTGYINISRSREFYISWTSDYISSSNPANLIIIAVAINFLLVADGSAVLRFAT